MVTVDSQCSHRVLTTYNKYSHHTHLLYFTHNEHSLYYNHSYLIYIKFQVYLRRYTGTRRFVPSVPVSRDVNGCRWLAAGGGGVVSGHAWSAPVAAVSEGRGDASGELH